MLLGYLIAASEAVAKLSKLIIEWAVAGVRGPQLQGIIPKTFVRIFVSIIHLVGWHFDGMKDSVGDIMVHVDYQ